MNSYTTRTAVELLLAARFLRQIQGTFKNLLFTSFLLSTIFYISLGMTGEAGIIAFEQNDLAEAKNQFKQDLAKDNKDVIALHYLAKIALRERGLDDAEEYIENAQQLSPMNAEIQFDAGHIMGAQAMDSSIFSAPGYARKTLKAFKKAAELEPETLRYRQQLMSFYLQAPGLLGGDEELAMVEAKAIAEIDEVQGFLAMASIYQNSDEYDKLETLYASAQQKFPNNAHIFFHRGKYYQSQEKFNLAIADFKEVQTLKAENEEDFILYTALYEIGRSSVLSKSFLDDGIKALQIYIESAPYDNTLPPKAWAKYRLGLLLARNGDRVRARTLYKEARAETKDKTLLRKLKRALKKRR